MFVGFLTPDWPSDMSSFIDREGEWCDLFLAKDCRRVPSWPLFHGSNIPSIYPSSSPCHYGRPLVYDPRMGYQTQGDEYLRRDREKAVAEDKLGHSEVLSHWDNQ